jgi:hypothetical protein
MLGARPWFGLPRDRLGAALFVLVMPVSWQGWAVVVGATTLALTLNLFPSLSEVQVTLLQTAILAALIAAVLARYGR